MMSIGEQLKAARQERGLSLDQIADETNIAKRYLEALEAENFSVFPGEPYILGFLRNYADFLGLEPQALINSFRGIRIQEQPVPFEALLHDKRKVNIPLLITIGAVAVVSVTAILLWNSGLFSSNKQPVAAENRIPLEYSMDSTSFEERLYAGDSLKLQFHKREYIISLEGIGERVTLNTPAGNMQYMLAEESTIDLDNDNLPELKVFIRDYERQNPAAGALVRLTATDSLIAEGSLVLGDTEELSESVILDPEAFVDTAAATAAQKIVFSGKRSPHPFVLNVTFRNQAMFRHEIDRQAREERFYFRGDEITATAINTAKLWTSNAAATRLIIQASGSQSVEVELGSPGQVTVKQLRWTQAEDGSWSLGLYEVN